MHNAKTFLVDCEICDRSATIASSREPGIYICSSCWSDFKEQSDPLPKERNFPSGHPELT